ncbi:MAG TPA: DinB family protein [Candidatus Kapabacteria bacterium]|nr:DinB family protein [Candidatus Kapabacteria bacterium]
METKTDAVELQRPDPAEYASYYERYISQVAPGTNILDLLAAQSAETVALLGGIEESRGNRRYVPGKWSINEVVGHVIDTERVFAYRILRFSRNDATALEGFDQDQYVANADFDSASLEGLCAEFADVRRSTIALLRHLQPGAWLRCGIANGNKMSVRALAYIVAGHERHHMAILRERYL